MLRHMGAKWLGVFLNVEKLLESPLPAQWVGNFARVQNFLEPTNNAVFKLTSEANLNTWLNCETQEAIAAQVGVTHQTVSNWLQKFAELQKFAVPPGARRAHFGPTYWLTSMPSSPMNIVAIWRTVPFHEISLLLWHVFIVNNKNLRPALARKPALAYQSRRSPHGQMGHKAPY
jgi:hypothetical protein